MPYYKSHINRLVYVSLLCILLSVAHAQQSTNATISGISNDTIEVPFYFRLNGALLIKDLRNNNQSLEQLREVLEGESANQVTSIRIVGSASPEGTVERNRILSHRRAQAIKRHIRLTYPHIQESHINIDTVFDAQTLWRQAVENDPDIPRREKVLEIVRLGKSLPTQWANIRLLSKDKKGKDPAKYIVKHIFPQLRNAVSCLVTSHQVASDTLLGLSSLPATTNIHIPLVEITDNIWLTRAGLSALDMPARSYLYKPLFALKTNLLFDAATLLNIEIEVPIKKRWSIAGEWIFPWWLWERKQNCLQLLSGNIEGRYWFGNRDRREVMTGWFAGLYTGGGYYDLEWDKTGYQGEFFIASGVSGGFAHKISKHLRMEYSLGVGYLQTKYRKYEARLDSENEWHLYRKESGKYSWFGPVKAKVSLVWMIGKKQKRGK